MAVNRSRTRTVMLVGVLVALLASGCAAGDGTEESKPSREAASEPARSYEIGGVAESTGPAEPVPGARPGGTVRVLQFSPFAHLDPAQVYPADTWTASLLFTRTLTTYKQVDGKVILVGDIATDAGQASDGGRIWTYTLKDGIKFEDGTEVTSEHVKYGIERLYDDAMTLGPKYIPQWLSGAEYREAYPGPFDGASLPSSVVETPDDKTIVFHLESPHAEFPYVVAMAASAPVHLERGDDPRAYDQRPSSTGPYRIESADDKSMVLVRNEHWDAATDPVRHNYPDRWVFEFGIQGLQLTQRLVAETGDDANAMTLTTPVDPQYLPQLASDPGLKARSLTGISGYSYWMAINTRRIKDARVREAIIRAFPRQQALQVLGGPAVGDLATTVLTPNVQGYEPYDVFKVPPTGDPDGARRLLEQAGAPHPTIVYAYGQSETADKMAVAVVQGLEKAGFEVVRKPLNASTYYDEITKLDNGFDLYQGAFAPDWPGGGGLLPVIFDGRSLADGSYNYSKVNDPEINAEIDRIGKIADVTEQSKAWMALDRMVVEKALLVPFYHGRANYLHGSNVGGAFLSRGPAGSVYPVDVYLKG